MDNATIFWIVLLGSCVALTALGTLDKYDDWRDARQGRADQR